MHSDFSLKTLVNILEYFHIFAPIACFPQKLPTENFWSPIAVGLINDPFCSVSIFFYCTFGGVPLIFFGPADDILLLIHTLATVNVRLDYIHTCPLHTAIVGAGKRGVY